MHRTWYQQSGTKQETFYSLVSFSQNFFVGVLIESNQKGLAFSERRSPQIAGRTEEQFTEGLAIRLLFFQVDMDDLRSFENVQFIDPGYKLERLIQSILGLFRVNKLVRLYLLVLEELLSSGARDSTWAMINPIKRHGQHLQYGRKQVEDLRE